MSITEILMDILKKEYGISTPEELKTAIDSQLKIDISVFCKDEEQKKHQGICKNH